MLISINSKQVSLLLEYRPCSSDPIEVRTLFEIYKALLHTFNLCRDSENRHEEQVFAVNRDIPSFTCSNLSVKVCMLLRHLILLYAKSASPDTVLRPSSHGYFSSGMTACSFELDFFFVCLPSTLIYSLCGLFFGIETMPIDAHCTLLATVPNALSFVFTPRTNQHY